MRAVPVLGLSMAAATVLCGTLGCDGLVYVAHVTEGQFAIQGHTEPIDSVLASGRLTEDQETKLRLLVKARDFAAASMGLRVGGSYKEFYDTQGDPLAFNLTAARRDKLVPKTWTFPIVGEVPYLAFFDEDYLHRVERELQDEGYDTLTYELDAYSTLGVFDDPVRSTMLERGDLSLVETVIHELLHNTIYRQGDTVFNESLATFVGRQGAVEFLSSEFGEEAGWAQLARDYYADVDRANAFLLSAYGTMAAYYARDLSASEKIAGRDAEFAALRAKFVADVQPTLNYPNSFNYLANLPTNNAWLLANYRYNLDLAVFASVHTATGGAWADSLAVFRAAAANSDPFGYLRTWLVEHATAAEAP